MGLFGATGVGVGAIVGGGILALAGVAFAATGPAALVAFALNGVIAVLTALSFAEIAAAFPQSGGTYNFAKRFLSVRVAFGVGWVAWFASLVAAVLYALGFGTFAVLVLREAAPAVLGHTPDWVHAAWTPTLFGVAATLVYSVGLLRRSGGGGQWINVTKTLVFLAVIAGGVWALGRTPGEVVTDNLRPFFSRGSTGLFQAMGFTFIALQGFDLIAAVAGEVKDPARNIPRAMLLSLAIALAIYLPLIFLVSAAGVGPGESIAEMSRQDPEGVIAVAARRFLGDFGYWLVAVAGVLAMLSALQANLFAASRVAHAMARDRTLSPVLGNLDAQHGIPRLAVLAVTGLVVGILVLVPDVATAGAAASLIFLVTFFVAHGINLLFHRRISVERMPFRVRFFPLVPILGGLACLALAVYQGVSVPVAGIIALAWLLLGGVLYVVRFAGRAAAFDAASEGTDPALVQSRGRNPLVLVPLRNAANAASMVAVAHAVSPPGYGRVLLLNVVRPPETWSPGEAPESLLAAERVVREAMTASFAEGLTPQAMLTVSAKPLDEIRRVARTHHCDSVLVGLRDLTQPGTDVEFDRFLDRVACDVLLLRAPTAWKFREARRVLVAVGGRGRHSPLRARLLGSLRRVTTPETTYLCVLPEQGPPDALTRMRRRLRQQADDEVGGAAHIEVVRAADPAQEIVDRAANADLLILGLYQEAGRHLRLSDFLLRIARETDCALLVVGYKAMSR
jgi:amino acid transporter/nucleotide-binding universal stress UspA family protein